MLQSLVLFAKTNVDAPEVPSQSEDHRKIYFVPLPTGVKMDFREYMYSLGIAAPHPD